MEKTKREQVAEQQSA